MKTKDLLRFMLVVAFAAMFSGVGYAQGVIIPLPCERRPCPPMPIPRPQVVVPNVLPVKSINIDTNISGQVATTHVEQVFRNDTNMSLEGTYFFPVPETASITEFAIWENGRKLVGEVRTREEARRIYEDIVRRQRDPGLLEYAGRNLFQATIFPIEPNSDKKLEITYSQILKADSGTVGYTYPLGIGRNLWRGRGDRSVRPSAQTFGTVSGKIEIEGRSELRNIYSPTHQIDLVKKGETGARISFETKNNDSDFQLFYGISADEFGLTLLTHREPGKDGYFLLMLSPKDIAANEKVVSKDIVFVIDTSGSMADAGKIEKAKAALLFGIRTLRDGDRFNVINFAGEEHLMESGLIEANATGKKKGETFVSALEPTGGTNINDAMIAALKQFSKSERPKMLVFMTDGLPTVGEQNEEKILANIAKAKSLDVRVFPFGFGYDVNTALLDRLGSENAGVSDYVQPKEDLEVKVSGFFSRVSAPVLSDLEIDWGSVQPEFMYPRKLTDLFRGMQLTIIGRYKNAADLRRITLRLKGKDGNGTRSFDYSGLDFPARSDENKFLPRLWASRRVGWLIEQIRANGETKELRDEVVELGTKFGIVTPYTSYLATDGTVQIRDLPMAAMSPGVAARSGAAAVKQSVQQNTMQSNNMVVAAEKESADEILVRNTTQNQFVANKSFVNQNNVWTDAEYKDGSKMQIVKIVFGSDAYFALVNNESDLAPYLALGEQVTVVWKGKIYMITK